MKAATIALVVVYDEMQRDPLLLETLSDDREIAMLESASGRGVTDPLRDVLDARDQQKREEDEFGDYVEELLCQPFLKPEIREHGVQWLKSKLRIEQYQQTEAEAAKIIADFAYKVYSEDPTKTDFILAGPSAKVRVRVFVTRRISGALPTPQDQAA